MNKREVQRVKRSYVENYIGGCMEPIPRGDSQEAYRFVKERCRQRYYTHNVGQAKPGLESEVHIQLGLIALQVLEESVASFNLQLVQLSLMEGIEKLPQNRGVRLLMGVPVLHTLVSGKQLHMRS